MPRTNLQIKVGTYTGNGSDGRNISGIGFEPQLVIIKQASTSVAVFRTKEVIGDKSEFLGANTAEAADNIQFLQPDGFQVGTAANVNTNAVVYHYIALRGASSQRNFKTGSYTGNASANRNYTGTDFTFTPDVAITKSVGTNNAALKTIDMIQDSGSANCVFFSATGLTANKIQQLIAGGMQLGTGGEINSSGQYFFFVLKKLDGVINCGTYTGTGATNSITGLGFTPSAVIVKGAGGTAAVLKTSTMTTTESFKFNGSGAQTTAILSLDSDGFTLGTSADVNGAATVYYWIALKDGNFNGDILRTAA